MITGPAVHTCVTGTHAVKNIGPRPPNLLLTHIPLLSVCVCACILLLLLLLLPQYHASPHQDVLKQANATFVATVKDIVGNIPLPPGVKLPELKLPPLNVSCVYVYVCVCDMCCDCECGAVLASLRQP